LLSLKARYMMNEKRSPSVVPKPTILSTQQCLFYSGIQADNELSVTTHSSHYCLKIGRSLGENCTDVCECLSLPNPAGENCGVSHGTSDTLCSPCPLFDPTCLVLSKSAWYGVGVCRAVCKAPSCCLLRFKIQRMATPAMARIAIPPTTLPAITPV